VEPDCTVRPRTRFSSWVRKRLAVVKDSLERLPDQGMGNEERTEADGYMGGANRAKNRKTDPFSDRLIVLLRDL
jgi:hypothetical protein